MEPLPIAYPPGIVKTSTPAGLSGRWEDGQLIRWVSNRLRPVLGWSEIEGVTFASPPRAMHRWVDLNGQVRTGILCERHLYVLEGEQLLNVTPTIDGTATPPMAAGILPPGSPRVGGYGDDAYGDYPTPAEGPNLYGTPRSDQNTYREIGEAFTLSNWGEDLLAMSSVDGRLLRWQPNLVEPNLAKRVTNAPQHNRCFVVTPERHVMLFGMGGKANKFGWCSQEDIDDWDFTSTLNTAGWYEVEPAARILDAKQTRYSICFWTAKGTYAVFFKGLPYIYTYEYLGAYNGPMAPGAGAVYSGNVIWPALDGFWAFNGTAVQQVRCEVLDWFQQLVDHEWARQHMTGFFNGAASELWWFFPSKGRSGTLKFENDHCMIYNFEEKWWSIGKLHRTCGVPGTITDYPYMASTTKLYRHEFGEQYPDLPVDENDRPILPYIKSGAINLDKGKTLATVRQILVDTDAGLDDVTYQIDAIKARHRDADTWTKGRKAPRYRVLPDGTQVSDGKIDYRITGRDFYLTLGSSRDPVKPWTFGEGQLLIAPRGRKGGE